MTEEMKYRLVCDEGGHPLFLQSVDGSRTVPLEKRNRMYQRIDQEIGVENLERVTRKV